MNAAPRQSARALVVDDEADIRELLEITLGRMNVASEAASDLATARQLFDEQHFDLCLTDMRLPDGEGVELVRHINQQTDRCPVAVITAYGSAESAVASLKAGAFDFVSKPIDVAGLRALVGQALKLGGLDQNAPPHPTLDKSPRLVGTSRPIVALRHMIAKLARSQAPVYVTGESGTGKELVARMIHAEGPRVHGAFVPVNCGAIPTELMESEFFGYVAGAFTGALRDTPGLFSRADGGTLFLDEIADLPLTMQVKLLRAIQERAVRPVGATRETALDVRVVSASHRDLSIEVSRGRFREDLYYRLNVIEVKVAPLRERREDIPVLAERILAGLAGRLGLDAPPQLSQEAITTLRGYDFPGNVRELENILERAVTLAEADEIGPNELCFRSPPSQVAAQPSKPTAEPTPTPTDERGDLESQLEAVERERIQKALEACRYNKTRTAEKLGISFRALRYRLAKLGMD